jgi:hypothetical protein
LLLGRAAVVRDVLVVGGLAPAVGVRQRSHDLGAPRRAAITAAVVVCRYRKVNMFNRTPKPLRSAFKPISEKTCAFTGDVQQPGNHHYT